MTSARKMLKIGKGLLQESQQYAFNIVGETQVWLIIKCMMVHLAFRGPDNVRAASLSHCHSLLFLIVSVISNTRARPTMTSQHVCSYCASVSTCKGRCSSPIILNKTPRAGELVCFICGFNQIWTFYSKKKCEFHSFCQSQFVQLFSVVTDFTL